MNSKGGGGRMPRLVVEKNSLEKKKDEIGNKRRPEEEDGLW